MASRTPWDSGALDTQPGPGSPLKATHSASTSLRLNLKRSEDSSVDLVANLPSPDLCAELDIDCSLALAYFDVPRSLAQTHGLDWSWQRDGDLIQIEVTRGCG